MEGPRSSLPITAVYGFLGLGYGGGGIMSAEVPHFHPGVLLDQGGFGFGLGNTAVGGGAATAVDLGTHGVANNIVLASFASQLLANAPTPPRDDRAGGRTPSDEMDDELYGVAGCDSHVAASLRCPLPSPSPMIAIPPPPPPPPPIGSPSAAATTSGSSLFP
jgi:hypothetical protein